MKTVALFGGSFDPPHIGHIAIIKQLKALPFIDKIVIMPTYLNPFKDKFYASSTKRLEWLQTLFSNDEKIIVSDYEVNQQRKVPTYETVLMLEKEFDKIYVVIGADNVISLPKWYNFEKLKQKVSFIVFGRDGITVPKEYLFIPLDINISSTQLRNNFDKTKVPAIIADDIAKEYNANKS